VLILLTESLVGFVEHLNTTSMFMDASKYKFYNV